MSKRIYNFNAGPAVLPLSVLEEIQATFLDFAGTGMSITEVSHRSKPFENIINDGGFKELRPNGDSLYYVKKIPGAISPMTSLASISTFTSSEVFLLTDEGISAGSLAISTFSKFLMFLKIV